MFKTITARFQGTCVRCRKAGIADGRQVIKAGESMRFGGKGQTYHLSKCCPASQRPTCSSQSATISPASSSLDQLRQAIQSLAADPLSPTLLAAVIQAQHEAQQAPVFAAADDFEPEPGDYYDREAAHDFFGDDR